MFSLTTTGVAVSFAFFMFRSCVATIAEYMPLFMAQLGYSTTYVGLVPVLGFVTQVIGIPIAGYLSDKFRMRKHLLLICILLSIPSTLLFLAPKAPDLTCEESSSGNITESFGNSSIVHNSVMNASSAEKNVENPLGNSETKYDGDMVKFFLIILFLRGFFELVKRLSVTLITVAAVTHVKQDKSKFGFYAFWGEIGAGISLFIVGTLAGHIPHLVCGKEVPSYYVVFFYAAAVQCMTLISLPWLEYEYLEKRVVDYEEVKSVLSKPHYILVLFICAHAGFCTAFQLRWEFWYMRHLGGTPVVMAVGGLLRRLLVGVWYIISRVIIGKLGELYVIAISLFLFAASFAGLAFTENAWLVIFLDSFQSVSFVLTYASLVIHFSKAGSKASSAFFQGVVNLTFHGIGKELGSAVFGICFEEFGTRLSFCGFSVVTVAWMAVFTIYIFCAKDVHSYQEVPREEEVSDDDREIK
ncbi:uncharacterized protein LOC114544416 [Dendronephthya gigantea]|uniref:uncharacterized protein LOC114515585 n=1 Tax=Dendronephthya gigantea TaxID=151771 RepID=UPI00106A9D92|nr:uncharacterized protein LOC114515585 [Dendronephthya gigantea]XP_028418415.1 uncharacterized protein LOC114543765 [Dendronephthya gigantea]XP_028418866.1 uncharacterized protein LOC114544416 [Dendronephthya gigantea]